MTLIEPVSSLSIKRAVNLYTIVLFISFGILLYWLATDRYQIFVNFHEDLANNTTKIVAFETSKTLKEKQRIIDIFVETYKGLITELSNNPDDEDIRQKIEKNLKKYQPDYFTFNIMTPKGEPIISDFDGDIGELCFADLRHYIKTGDQNIRLHPNHNQYHYDIISEYSTGNTEQLFFVSFKTDELSDLLNSTQPEKHNLILINKEQGNLIEITPQGNRLEINRLDYRMNGNENLRTLSTTRVKGTSWHVTDMYNKGLLNDYRTKIIKEYVIAFYVFMIIALFMRNILINQDEKRTTAEEQLKKNHKQIKHLNHQLETLSKTDSLTGLFNRRYFDERILREWNRGLRSKQTLSCILLDIDFFKNFNDFYGHQAGDKCLKDISVLMKDTFRRAGDIVARYGGEEFIIIMSETGKKGAESAMTQFQKELDKLKIPHQASSISDQVTISAGLVSCTPSNEMSIEEFIDKADKALYQAKDNGRNQYVVHDPLEKPV